VQAAEPGPIGRAGQGRVSTIRTGVRARDAISDSREAHFDVEAASRLRVGSDRSAVGVGDGLHDGEPETDTVAAAGAVGAESLEGLEEPLDCRGRHDGSGVSHGNDGLSAAGLGRHVDVAVGHVVAGGVVHKIGDQPFDEAGIAKPGGRAEHLVHLDRAVIGVAAGLENLAGHGGEVEGCSPLEPRLSSREGEERFDEPFLLVPSGEHREPALTGLAW
jgi:hypothetical protein